MLEKMRNIFSKLLGKWITIVFSGISFLFGGVGLLFFSDRNEPQNVEGNVVNTSDQVEVGGSVDRSITYNVILGDCGIVSENSMTKDFKYEACEGRVELAATSGVPFLATKFCSLPVCEASGGRKLLPTFSTANVPLERPEYIPSPSDISKIKDAGHVHSETDTIITVSSQEFLEAEGGRTNNKNILNPEKFRDNVNAPRNARIITGRAGLFRNRPRFSFDSPDLYADAGHFVYAERIPNDARYLRVVYEGQKFIISASDIKWR